jgi:hypothetical protein
MHQGTFEAGGRGAALLVGRGVLEVTPAGVRMQGMAPRTSLATALAVLAGAIATIGAVVAAFAVLDRYDLISDGDSLKPAVACGMAALVGTFLGAKAVLVRLLPMRSFDQVVAYRHVVWAVARSGVLHLSCSAPECTGRMAFRASDANGLAEAIKRAKGS